MATPNQSTNINLRRADDDGLSDSDGDDEIATSSHFFDPESLIASLNAKITS